MMWYWGSGVHWWGWLIGALLTVAFWMAVVWLGWYVITTFVRRPSGPPAPPDTAKQILDERLARGEIDAEEYRRLRDVLHEGRGDRVGGTSGQR